MRLIPILCSAACLLCGCASDGTTGTNSARYVYSDWLYYEQGWYDDDFWIWVDEHPDCCDDQDDLKKALQDWYDGLEPVEQQAVRDRGPDLDGRARRSTCGGTVGQGAGARDRLRALGRVDAPGASPMARSAAHAHRATPGGGFGAAPDLRAAGRVNRARRESEPRTKCGFAGERPGHEFRPVLRSRQRRRLPLAQPAPDPGACRPVRRCALPGREGRRPRGRTRPVGLPRANPTRVDCLPGALAGSLQALGRTDVLSRLLKLEVRELDPSSC